LKCDLDMWEYTSIVMWFIKCTNGHFKMMLVMVSINGFLFCSFFVAADQV
jgi:hypothetical protein